MAAKNVSGYFCGKRPANGSRKTEELKRAAWANGECQVCRSKGVKGNAVPLAELRGGSLFIGVPG